MTMAHLCNENLQSKALKYLAEHILHIPPDKIKKYDDVTPGTPEFCEYGMDDAVYTWQLYQKFDQTIYEQNLSHLMWDIEMPFQRALVELAINGIGADKEAARVMRYETQHLYYTIENELLEMCGGEYIVSITPRSRVVSCKPSINFNSPEQVIPLVEALGFEIFERTKKKKKSFAKAAKKRLEGQHPFIDLLIKFGKVEKLLNGFLNPFEEFIDEDGRIRCSFNNTVAVTGRLSCSSPNIEQLPRQNNIANIRNLFICRRDSVFIVADYSGQELRILGEQTQDPALIKELRAGLDLHQVFADTFGLSRTDAKCISFGIPYGKQAYGFAKDWGWSLERAQDFLDEFFAKYSGVKTAIEQARKSVSLRGYVTNLSGRRRRFPDFKKKTKWQKERCYRQAFNFLIQSFASDCMKVAAAKIIQDKNLKLCNIIHDEVVVECPKMYLKQGIKHITESMINTIPISIPWEVDVSSGNRYGECK